MYIFGTVIGRGCIFAILSCCGYIFQMDSMGMNNILNPAMFNTKTSYKSLIFLRVRTIKTITLFYLSSLVGHNLVYGLSRKQIGFLWSCPPCNKVVYRFNLTGTRKKKQWFIIYHFTFGRTLLGFKYCLGPWQFSPSNHYAQLFFVVTVSSPSCVIILFRLEWFKSFYVLYV